MNAEVRILDSITEVGETAWNACAANHLQSGPLEDYAYLLATEQSGMAGFTWRYVTAWRGNILIATMAAFLTNYALDTTLEGTGRKITGAITSFFPNILSLKLACLGSPNTEFGLMGFHPSASQEKNVLLRGMIEAFEAYAVQHKHKLIGIKDVPECDRGAWEEALLPLGYKRMGGLPVAILDVDFTSLDQYLGRLSPGTRKDMRRKLRGLDQIRVERRYETVEDVMPALMRLYKETRARAEMKFEELTPAFFNNVLASSKGRAFFALYYAGDELLGANLMLQDDMTLLDKFFVMDGTRGREYNLYFLSWFLNIDYCIDHKIKFYQSGQAAYANKRRLGSRLNATSMYFRHKNILLQGALGLVAPLLAPDDAMVVIAKEAA